MGSMKHKNLLKEAVLHSDEQNFLRSWGKQVYVVEGLDDAATSLNDAVADIRSSGDTTFPGTEIPLASIKPVSINESEAKIVCIFKYDPFTSSSTTELVARYADASEGIQWYKTTEEFDGSNRPNGDVQAKLLEQKDKKPQPWYWTVSTQSMSIPFELSFNPVPSTNPKRNQTNNDGVTFDGMTYDPFQLRYNGLTMDSRVSQGGDRTYFGHYNFTIRADTWQHQRLSGGGDADWAVETEDTYGEGTGFQGNS